MPTGYTADLNDGKQVTFQEFTMKCARAFGALIEMRDDLGGLSSPPLKAGPGRRPRRRSNDERRDEKKRQHAPGRP